MTLKVQPLFHGVLATSLKVVRYVFLLLILCFHVSSSTEANEIPAKPLILMVGPWSTGKSTLINYLVGLEDTVERLHTGAEPTTSDFFVLKYGPKYRKFKGMELVSDEKQGFASLEKLGLNFLERLQGIEMQSPLLESVSFVDTPGIIENKKQQERGYPFNEVLQWFIQRASLILLVFDPTKLEVGSELEQVVNILKGHDGKLRLILNKADTVGEQELMKVYGALFWSLAPLMHSVEPPRIYMGSFWSKKRQDNSLIQLFEEEEKSVLLDLHQAIENQVENKISYIRRHAFLVRLHALIVDTFLSVFEERKSWFGDSDDIWFNIVHNPGMYGVVQRVLQKEGISKHDLKDVGMYVEFFQDNLRTFFRPLSHYCPIFDECLLEKVSSAISDELPRLLTKLKTEKSSQSCSKDSCDP
ncbi:sarcalumenin isoform X2 [Aplysia californica]|uniref:Sarcalumenin isoform X2 n=1 Tax=Aplysia californica TaxID=6500 RepID=A0ABM1VYK9_APLCA|nr:sarcalumenin isoform X2 [Aplysia californica]